MCGESGLLLAIQQGFRPYHRPTCEDNGDIVSQVRETIMSPDRTEPSERSVLRNAVALLRRKYGRVAKSSLKLRFHEDLGSWCWCGGGQAVLVRLP